MKTTDEFLKEQLVTDLVAECLAFNVKGNCSSISELLLQCEAIRDDLSDEQLKLMDGVVIMLKCVQDSLKELYKIRTACAGQG